MENLNPNTDSNKRALDGEDAKIVKPTFISSIPKKQKNGNQIFFFSQSKIKYIRI